MQPDYEHWFEVLLGGLIALGCWLWRVGRQYQKQEDRLKHLEEEAAEERRKRTERDAKIFARLDEIGRIQERQGVQIDHIAESCAETRADVRNILATPRPGGRRNYDPPAGE